QDFSVWGFIKGFGKLVLGFLLLLQGIVGLIVLLAVIGVLTSVSGVFSGENDPANLQIESGSAFVLNPAGVIVEQAPEDDPFEEIIEEAYGIQEPSPISLTDVVRTIRAAKDDDRIKAMILDLDSVAIGGTSKAYTIIDEIEAFKESEKKVYAIGDFYGQTQYLIASHADEVHLNDGGAVALYGYGIFRNYYKSLLDKLKITSHVFRVGTFKAAVEPRLGDEMSEAAKEANGVLINSFWGRYKNDIATTRGLAPEAVHQYADAYNVVMAEYKGDAAAAALGTGLVDKTFKSSKMRAFLVETFGKGRDDKGFKSVGFRSYLKTLAAEKNDASSNDIAIITAAGIIMPGRSRPGQTAGSTTLVEYLEKARKDDDVKAIVLRVDSPGGSAFASEKIHDAILAIKEKGKPVIVSMGSLAASGGYLIAAPADEIWAAPTTITGSIGIFAAFETFENSLAEIGVYTDGIGTTAQSGLLATGLGPLPAVTAEALQLGTENGYERFLNIVAEGRDLTRDYVDSVGQGRVWAGDTALDLKLVDKLGSLDDAVKSAASLAGLTDYDVVRYEDRRTAFEKLFSGASASVVRATGAHEALARHHRSGVGALMKVINESDVFLQTFDDPNHLYMRCLACEAVAAPR
ncbi:MAG: signal peptide peptidase SppA, partial [Pseudomonadota bacterium]